MGVDVRLTDTVNLVRLTVPGYCCFRDIPGVSGSLTGRSGIVSFCTRFLVRGSITWGKSPEVT